MTRPARGSVEQRIAALELEVATLRAIVARRAPRPITDADGDLLVAIAQTIGATVFSAAELVRHAAVAGGPLAAALTACGLTTARRVGKRLQALQGRAIRGFTVVRLGVDSSGAVWAVVAC